MNDLVETPETEFLSYADTVTRLADRLRLEDAHLLILQFHTDSVKALGRLAPGWSLFLVGNQTHEDNPEAVFYAPHGGPRMAAHAMREAFRFEVVHRLIGIPYPIAIVSIPDALDAREWAVGVGLDADVFDRPQRVIATAEESDEDLAPVPLIVVDAMKVAWPDRIESIEGQVEELTAEDVARLRGIDPRAARAREN